MYLFIKMFRRRGAADERERVDAFHGFLRGELTKELRQAIKLVQTESASQQQQAVLGIFGFILIYKARIVDNKSNNVREHNAATGLKYNYTKLN